MVGPDLGTKQYSFINVRASQVVLVVKNLPASAGDTIDTGSIPGSGRVPGGGNGNLLQYSCLENSMYRGAWRDSVHVVTKLDTTYVLNINSSILQNTSKQTPISSPTKWLEKSHHHYSK